MTHRNNQYRNMAAQIIKLHGPMPSAEMINRWFDMPATRANRRKMMPTKIQLAQILRTDKRFTKVAMLSSEVAVWGLAE